MKRGKASEDASHLLELFGFEKRQKMEQKVMSKKKTWLSGFLGGIAVSILLGGVGFFVTYGTLPFVGDSLTIGKTARKTAKIERLIKENYLEDVENSTIAEGMYAGMMASLEDRYSGYFSKEQYKRFQESSEGRYRDWSDDGGGSGDKRNLGI